MLSNGFDMPLRLKLKSSRLFLRFQAFLHLLAVIAIYLPSSIPLFIKAIFMAYVIFSAYKALRTFLDKQRESFVWLKEGDWLSQSSDGDRSWQPATGNLVTAWFVVVNLKAGRDSRQLLIFNDQIDTETFRRLKVRLKYFHGEAILPTDAS
ncbi:MAG: hypothetical protein PVG75_01240 [Thioalkalispiraceae bacterium]